MECKFCKAENDDAAVYCKDCGRRVDGNMTCPWCGKLTEGAAFCVFCGNPLDGRVKCSRCDTLYDGAYCTECGYPAPKKIRPSDVRIRFPRSPRAFAYNGADGTDGADGASKDAEDAPAWKKTLSFSLPGVALVALLSIFVLMFFTGMEYKVTGYGASVSGGQIGAEKYSLYHFFGKAYSDIKDAGYLYETVRTAAYTISVLGTITAVCMLGVVTAMTAVTATKFVRKILGREVKHLDRSLFLTYFLYLAFALVFKNLLAAKESYSDVVVRIGLNSATIAGLSVGGALVGVYFVGRLVLCGRKLLEKATLAKIGPSLLFLVLLVVAIALLSGATSGLTEKDSSYYYGYTYYYKYTYRYNYLYYAIVAESESYGIYALGLVAQLFSVTFFMLACASCADRLSDVTEGKDTPRSLWLEIGAFIALVLVLALAVATVSKTCSNLGWGEYDGEGKTFSYLIAGFVLVAASVPYELLRSAGRGAKEGDAMEEST